MYLFILTTLKIKVSFFNYKINFIILLYFNFNLNINLIFYLKIIVK
jgi:hypothetical protein